MKERLSTLVGLHGRSTGPAGEKLYGDDKGKTEKVYHEVQRPAVIEHPVSGRPILFVNPMHTHGFTSMTRVPCRAHRRDVRSSMPRSRAAAI